MWYIALSNRPVARLFKLKMQGKKMAPHDCTVIQIKFYKISLTTPCSYKMANSVDLDQTTLFAMTYMFKYLT